MASTTKHTQERRGRVALVTGASRGAGKGIALELAERGWTVVVTGRTPRGARGEGGVHGTVHDTAAEVDARGGRGVPVICDHTDEAQVAALLARVGGELGRLDLLVNNAWGGYEAYDGAAFSAPFWEQPFGARWRGMFEAGLRAHMLATHLAVPLLAAGALVVCTVAWDRDKPLGSTYYDVAKHAIVRFVADAARDLARRQVAVVAVAPGFMRTERVVAVLGEGHPELAKTETPHYTGRVVAALAEDPRVMARSGQAHRVGDLAAEYGVVDVDGRQVPAFSL
jgi:NAD(P)-dependent dehydrogenase (short-subunit alcohol dehydrogenase family)